MLPDGVNPRPPMRPEDRSDIMSPYKLGITMTKDLYSDGSAQSLREVLSSSSKESLMSGYSLPTSLAVSTNKPSESFMMEALWTTLTSGLLTDLAYSKAYLMTLSEAGLVINLMDCTTPGTISCSIPEYSPSVFSLIKTVSTFSYGVFIGWQGGLTIDQRWSHVDRLPSNWDLGLFENGLHRGCNLGTNTITRDHGDGVLAVRAWLTSKLTGDLAGGVGSCERKRASCDSSEHWKY
ncbi:hypothetical protein OGATHE_001943 [Ogataea polymorpha]|uniref:Uncharacterized protein n=1 Tax=Ogataea polymorpha TaxID=460523 RepID=A0A9P8PKH5_9ASCO|nr:hypothetical protein OGATHE_001943 [Ogataea polymorpha]